MSSYSKVSRSAYTSQLRRAFLLRVHPDRFRNHSLSIRKRQAEVIQALSERMSATDFIDYTSSHGISKNSFNHQHRHNIDKGKTYIYYLEKKDGSLDHFTLRLDDSVENILLCMVEALKSTGLSMLQPPPSQSSFLNTTASIFFTSNNHGRTSENVTDESQQKSRINPIFNINTRKNRDFISFLSHLNTIEIQQRRSSRVDAIAAALVARQAYKFQSIDGTSLGWSSYSLAKCLQSFTKVYDDHQQKLHVKSFYPLRLLWSNDEFQHKLDLFGGYLMLNPCETPVQWLDTLMLVTEKSLHELNQNRIKMNDFVSHIQNVLNVNIQKGYSCSSREYYYALKNLSQALSLRGTDISFISDSKEIELGRIKIVVETDQACRRAILTTEGNIRVSAGMDVKTIISSISRLRNDARQRMEHVHNIEAKVKKIVPLLQYHFGLEKIYRIKRISVEEYLNCLNGLLNLSEDAKEIMKPALIGQSLGVTSSGQSCHLGDDGSIIIPFDWQ